MGNLNVQEVFNILKASLKMDMNQKLKFKSQNLTNWKILLIILDLIEQLSEKYLGL